MRNPFEGLNFGNLGSNVAKPSGVTASFLNNPFEHGAANKVLGMSPDTWQMLGGLGARLASNSAKPGATFAGALGDASIGVRNEQRAQELIDAKASEAADIRRQEYMTEQERLRMEERDLQLRERDRQDRTRLQERNVASQEAYRAERGNYYRNKSNRPTGGRAEKPKDYTRIFNKEFDRYRNATDEMGQPLYSMDEAAQRAREAMNQIRSLGAPNPSSVTSAPASPAKPRDPLGILR
jgi:hypothetical protein